MSDIPHVIYFNDKTPSGDVVGLEIDFNEMDVVIEVEEDKRNGRVVEYRVSIPKLLNMIELHSEYSLEFLKNQNF